MTKWLVVLACVGCGSHDDPKPAPTPTAPPKPAAPPIAFVAIPEPSGPAPWFEPQLGCTNEIDVHIPYECAQTYTQQLGSAKLSDDVDDYMKSTPVGTELCATAAVARAKSNLVTEVCMDLQLRTGTRPRSVKVVTTPPDAKVSQCAAASVVDMDVYQGASHDIHTCMRYLPRYSESALAAIHTHTEKWDTPKSKPLTPDAATAYEVQIGPPAVTYENKSTDPNAVDFQPITAPPAASQIAARAVLAITPQLSSCASWFDELTDHAFDIIAHAQVTVVGDKVRGIEISSGYNVLSIVSSRVDLRDAGGSLPKGALMIHMPIRMVPKHHE